jgi:hypothetical protein
MLATKVDLHERIVNIYLCISIVHIILILLFERCDEQLSSRVVIWEVAQRWTIAYN